LFSPEDEKTVIDNADKDTLFTFKIVKNAYNIPARDIGQCETFVDKIMIVK